MSTDSFSNKEILELHKSFSEKILLIIHYELSCELKEYSKLIITYKIQQSEIITAHQLSCWLSTVEFAKHANYIHIYYLDKINYNIKI